MLWTRDVLMSFVRTWKQIVSSSLPRWGEMGQEWSSSVWGKLKFPLESWSFQEETCFVELEGPGDDDGHVSTFVSHLRKLPSGEGPWLCQHVSQLTQTFDDPWGSQRRTRVDFGPISCGSCCKCCFALTSGLTASGSFHQQHFKVAVEQTWCGLLLECCLKGGPVSGTKSCETPPIHNYISVWIRIFHCGHNQDQSPKQTRRVILSPTLPRPDLIVSQRQAQVSQVKGSYLLWLYICLKHKE